MTVRVGLGLAALVLAGLAATAAVVVLAGAGQWPGPVDEEADEEER